MPQTMKNRVRDLSPRQREVVRIVSLGCTLSEIATILDLKPNTADVHKNTAMQILGAGKAATLTRLAIKYRISPLDDRLTPGEKRKLAHKA
ncbi:MAG: helix-turn-helix transcriptional regulator [Planctomycetes bacterium]|nr:helix-turn-helix transcriptional regulator [Planctomycetota bacterium]